jgi:chromosome segregation ATPase
MSNQLIDSIVENLNGLMDGCRSAKDDLGDLMGSANDIRDQADTVECRFDELERAIQYALDEIEEANAEDIERSAVQAVLRSTREDIDKTQNTLELARNRLLHYAETFGVQIVG